MIFSQRRAILLGAAALFTGLFLFHDHFAVVFLAKAPGGPFSGAGLARFLKDSAAVELPSFLLLLLIAAGAWGIGLSVLDRLRISVREPLDHCFALALGIGLLATGIFFLGLMQILYRSVLLLASAAALGGGLIRLERQRRAPGAMAWPSITEPGWAILGLALSGYALWHGWITAMAPILPGDSTVYHLSLPKLYLAAHRVYGIPWNLFSHWPHLTEMLFALPLSAGLDRTAPLLHWLCSAALAVSVYLVGRREADERTAWIALILLVCQRSFLSTSGTAYIEGSLGLFSFLSLYALWIGVRSDRPSWIILAGLLGGMMAAAKLLGAVPLALYGIWVLWKAPQGRKLRFFVLFAVSSSAIVGPWYVKTWIISGNPVWPFLPGLFGTREGGQEINRNIWTLRQETSLAAAYLVNFRNNTSVMNWSGDIFVSLLVLTLVAVLFRSQWPAMMGTWFYPILPYIAVLHPQSDFRRYLSPLWGSISLWEGWALAALSRRKPFGPIAAAVVILLALPVWQINEEDALVALSHWVPHVGGTATAEDFYYKTKAPYVLTFRKIDALLEPDSKVLLCGEQQTYYFTHAYQFADPTYQTALPFSHLPDPQALYKVLKEQKVTHLLIVDFINSDPDSYDRHFVDLVWGTAREFGRPLLVEDHRYLYKLEDRHR